MSRFRVKTNSIVLSLSTLIAAESKVCERGKGNIIIIIIIIIVIMIETIMT